MRLLKIFMLAVLAVLLLSVLLVIDGGPSSNNTQANHLTKKPQNR